MPSTKRLISTAVRALPLTALAAGLTILPVLPSTAEAAPSVKRVYFSLDPDGKYELNEIGSGSQFYIVIDYADVPTSSEFSHYALVNGSTDNVVVDNPYVNGPTRPSVSTGRIVKPGFVAYGTGGGIYTTVVQLNGQEVARQSMMID